MKYYLYLSKMKVDMLYEQLPERYIDPADEPTSLGREDLADLRRKLNEAFNETDLRNICWDLGIDYENISGENKLDKTRELLDYLDNRRTIPDLLEVLNKERPKISWPVANTNVSQANTPNTIYTKLQAVLDYIYENEPVGTVDKPEKFFAGKMPVRWGPGRGGADLTGMWGHVAFFGGATQNNTLVGLGGSNQHLLGSAESNIQNLDGLTLSSSTLVYFLTNFLSQDLQREKAEDLLHEPQPFGDTDLINALAATITGMSGPTQQVEFVAKRLLEGVSGTKQVLLGTPIYIALVE
jgi:hypothetical protein